jgi:hypothetical protein
MGPWSVGTAGQWAEPLIPSAGTYNRQRHLYRSISAAPSSRSPGIDCSESASRNGDNRLPVLLVVDVPFDATSVQGEPPLVEKLGDTDGFRENGPVTFPGG